MSGLFSLHKVGSVITLKVNSDISSLSGQIAIQL